MVLLQGLQGFLIALDGGLELADIFGATFAKGRLGLTVPLLPFLGRGIDLGVLITATQEITVGTQGKKEKEKEKKIKAVGQERNKIRQTGEAR